MNAKWTNFVTPEADKKTRKSPDQIRVFFSGFAEDA